MYVKDKIFKGDKIDYGQYLLQEVKARFIIKLNDHEGRNQNFY